MSDTRGREGSRQSLPILRGRIRDVHPSKWTVDVQLDDGGFIESASIVCPYFHQENGEGIFALPEVGAHCLFVPSSGDREPMVIGFTPLRSSDPGVTNLPEDDHSAGRGSATPGDILLHGRDGNFVRVRRGGLVEIGASEACRSMYFPVGDLIRSVSMNHEVNVGGGVAKWNVMDTPEIPTEGPTPVVLDIMLQEYVEKAPMINFSLGHIKDDERRHLCGSSSSIVYRLLIFSQETVDLAESASLPPSADQAVVQIRFDKDGNAEEIVGGQYLLQCGSRRLFILGNDVEFVGGQRVTNITGNVATEVGGDFSETVHGQRTIRASGTLTLEGERIILNDRRSRSENLSGNQDRSVGGHHNLDVGGDSRQCTGGGDNNTCAGDRAEMTGGKVVRTVVHAANPTSMLQGAIASLLTVLDGTIREHALAGDVEFMVGPPAAPLCRVRIHGAPNRPTEFGRLSIQWINPQQELIIDGLTGAIKYTNTLGSWEMDPTGRSCFGIQGAPAGNVVTTLTHPVCYLTGAPILGCAAVAAAGPPTPVPTALPLTPMVDNIPVPEVPLP